VVLAPRCWRQVLWRCVRPNRACDISSIRKATVARKPGHRGDHVISRKPLRGESRDDPVEPVVYSCAFCAHDRGCNRRPAFPAPSHLERRENDPQSSGRSCRENADACLLKRFPSHMGQHIVLLPSLREAAGRGRGWGVYRRTPLLRSMRQSFRLNRRARLAASLRHHPPPRPLRASFARLDPATRKGAWREGSEGIARRCRSKDGGGKWDGVRLTMAFPEPTRPGAVITRRPLPSISLCFPSEVFTRTPHFRLK